MAAVKSKLRQEAHISQATAKLTGLTTDTSRLWVEATGSYEPGIGRVGFVLVDLTRDSLSNVIDRKDADYAKPSQEVTDAWTSAVALTSGVPYRVFFHVYDRSGTNLMAYDRRDFACTSMPPNRKEQGK